MAKINRRSLFYWVRSSFTAGYWVEATTGGLSTDTLYAAVTSSATTIEIHRPSSNSTNEIVVGDRINIGEERMYVTASPSPSSPYTLTVTRGYDGTTATAHVGHDTDGTGLEITRGVEALVSTTVIDSLHNARQASFMVVNPSKNLFGTGVEVQGKLTNVFKPFQKILILDKATHQIIYTGYVKDIRDSYSMQQGKVISLQGVDILSELANFSSSDKDRFGDEGVIDGVSRISEQIEAILEDTGLTVISGVSRREAGNALLTTLSKNTTEANNDIFLFDASVQADAKEYNVARGSWTVLRHIDNLANSDSHDSEANKNIHVGYDFYATPYFVTPRPPSNRWTDNPDWQLNYFQRGSRPSSSTVTNALNIKYPLGTNDYSRAARPGALPPLDRPMKIMTTNASYVRSGNFIATSAIVTYTSSQDGEVESGTVQKTKEFELLYCNNLVKGSATGFNQNAGYPIARGSGSTYRPRAISRSGNMLSGANPASGGVSSPEADDNNTINALSEDEKTGATTEELGVAAELLRVETNSALDGSGSWTTYPVGHATTAVARLQWLSAICPGDGEGTAGHYANGVTGSSSSSSRLAAPTSSDEAIQMLVTFDLSDELSSVTKLAMTNHTTGLVRFVGMTSGFTIEFDNSHVTDSFWKGRPSRTLGVSRPKRLTIMDKPNLDDIRKEIAQSLVRDTRDIRKGTTAITEFPYSTLEGRVTAISGSSSNQRVIRLGQYTHPSGSAVGSDINAATFGLKSGMAIAFYDKNLSTASTSNPYATEFIYGYVASVNINELDITVNFPYDGTTAIADSSTFPIVGDYVRAYIAMRAGDVIRLENALESVLGNHLILRSNFVDEGGAFTTNLETIGDNEDLPARNLGGLAKPNITIPSPGTHGETLFNTPAGQQNFRFFGRVFVKASGSRTVVNNVSWGGGSSGNDKFTIELGTGQIYSVAAGNSYTALHKEGGVAIGALSTNNQSDINVADGTSSPVSTVWYTVYLDTSDTPDANGNYLLRVAPSSDIGTIAHNADHTDVEKYKSKTDHIRVLTIRSGSGGLNAEYQVYGEHVNWNKDTVRQFATATMIPDSFTAALAKKTLQPYTTSANVLPGDTSNANKTRYIHTLAGLISFSEGISSSGNVTLNASGNIDTYLSNNFAASIIHYIYFRLNDTNDAETNIAAAIDHATVHSTYNYYEATSDSRGLLAICTTGSASDQEISIQAFHGKGQNINADVIAAGAITAGAIKANSLDAFQITGGLIRTGINVQGTAGASESGDESGIVINSSGITGYNSSGATQFSLAASTGVATLGGTTIAATTLEGADLATVRSGTDWEDISGLANNTIPDANATEGATTTQANTIASNTEALGTKLGNTAGSINDISLIDPRLLGQGTLSANTVLAGQMAVGGHAALLTGTVTTVASMTQVKLCDLNGALTTHTGTTDDTVAINGAVSGVGVPNGSYLELVSGGTREVMRVTEGTASTGNVNIKVQRAQAGTSVPASGASWANNTVCNNPMRQYATLTATSAIFYEKHIGGVIEYTLSGTSTTQAAVITAVTNAGAANTTVTILRGSPLDNPLENLTANVTFVMTHLAGARVEMSPAGIRGFDSSDAAQFEILTSTGKGAFGAGAGVIDSTGLTITGSTANEKIILDEAGRILIGITDGTAAGGTIITKDGILTVGSVSTILEGEFGDFGVPTSSVGTIKVGGGSTATGYIEFWKGGHDVGSGYAASDKNANLVSRVMAWGLSKSTPGGVSVTVADHLTLLGSSGSGLYPGEIMVGLTRPYLSETNAGSRFAAFIPGPLSRSLPAATGDDEYKAKGNGWLGNNFSGWSGLYLETQEGAGGTNGSYAELGFVLSSNPVPRDVTNNGVNGIIYLQEIDPDDTTPKVAVRMRYAEATVLRNHHLIGVDDNWGNSGNTLESDGDGTFSWDTSARKYKENIVDLTINTANIFNLRAVNFKYKDEFKGGRTSFGFIADEVASVLPELVTNRITRDKETGAETTAPESVSYKLLSVLLLEELKKLKARVDTLEAG